MSKTAKLVDGDKVDVVSSYDIPGVRPKVDCSKDIPLTQQNAKDECDINLIVESAKRGADISRLSNARTPMYGDFTNLPDYRESLLIVKRAEQAFMTLDASVRKRFDNDPAQMLDFLGKEENREEAIKLGLVNPPVEKPVDEHLATLKSIDEGLKSSRSKGPGAKKHEQED